MADLQFPSVGNALLAGSQAAYSLGRGRREDEAERRRAEAQPYIEKAVQGDSGAFAKLAAGDPTTASAVAMALSRMDASKLAKAKEATDYTTGVTTGLLAAPEGERERLYQQTRADAQARGMDISRWPASYDPAWVQMQHGYGIGAKEWFQQQQQNQRANPGSTQVDMPGPGGAAPIGAPSGGGQYGGAIASIESAGAPNGGYGAVGPVADGKGSRAYGKYQVMDFNVGPWTQEILGKAMTPQEFAANPQAQDAVFNGKFGQYVQKYGSPEAAARAWFAGEGGMNNPNAADVNGMTVANYGRKFAGALGGQAPAPQVVGAPTPLIPAQAQAPAPGIPGPIAQGDTPQADGSGTPMPPGQQQAGPQPRRNGPVFEDEPTQFGYVMRGERDRYGNTTPIKVGDYLLFRNPQTKESVLWKPQAKADAGGPFPGNSVEANALNMLIADGTLTKNQAAQLAAGKTITNPADGSVMFMTPQGLFQRQDGQAPTPVAPGAGAAPPGASPATPPGMIPITPPKPLTPNNEQALAGGFADRMSNSNSIIAGVESEGKSRAGRFKEAVPFGMGNAAQSEKYQSFAQARDDFINAQLRRESGAAISPAEYANADKQYFPVPGDGPDVIKQKAINRQIVVEAMVKNAGPAYKPRAAESGGGGKQLSPEEAAKLPPGTKFIGTDGVERTRH